MCLRPEEIGPVPEETVRIARAAFPAGSLCMQMRDVLGPVYADGQFAHLFAARGQPAEAPWRLALVTVLQFAEGLSDRQAADAVRARIDWKYMLGLELTDPGFDFSVLCEFRGRLVTGRGEQLLLVALLEACGARGYLKARGRQRTDSTRVLGALRVLNRLERVAETLRSALNGVATAAPEWLRTIAPPEWFERYGRRVEDERLPRGAEKRQAYAEAVGADGVWLLAALHAPTAPPGLWLLPTVEVLRRIWLQQYEVVDGQVRLRDPRDMPPAADAVETPYEPEARYGAKRELCWTGYKVHVTESCDQEQPHLVTHVATTIAPASDVVQLAAVHDDLAVIDLLPAQHLVDAGYVRGQNLVAARDDHGVDLVGPMYENHQWQAKAKAGYDTAHFHVDWEARVVTCPQGRASVRWCETQTTRGPMVHVAFARAACAACPSRPLCTRAKTDPRSLTLQPRAEHEAIQAARRRQETPEFAAVYARRAGIEGTISQGVRTLGLRQARYHGLGKTHLQHLATAAAINLRRLADWLNNAPRSTTRCSTFAALARAA